MTDFVEIKNNLLPSYFRDKKKFNIFLDVFITKIQELSQQIQEKIMLDLENSTEHRLDIIGGYFNVKRKLNESDTLFRKRIKYEIILTYAKTTLPFFIDVVSKIIDVNQRFVIEKNRNIILYLNLKNENDLTSDVISILRKIKACGVGLKIYATVNDEIYPIINSLEILHTADGQKIMLADGSDYIYVYSEDIVNTTEIDSATFAIGLAIGDESEFLHISDGSEKLLITAIDRYV